MQGLMLAEARRAAAEASTGPLTKRINDQRSLQRWKKSEAHASLLKYISELGDAVVGRRVTDECDERLIISTIVAEFQAMSGWVDEIPPLQQAMRYGNKAFKTWHERLVERSHTMTSEMFERHGPACVEDTALAAAELSTYFVESFGSPLRVDYGELSKDRRTHTAGQAHTHEAKLEALILTMVSRTFSLANISPRTTAVKFRFQRDSARCTLLKLQPECGGQEFVEGFLASTPLRVDYAE
jgi:hypothetical protein